MITSNNSMQVGDKGPDFSAAAVHEQQFKQIRFFDYLGKYVVLLFYPMMNNNCLN